MVLSDLHADGRDSKQSSGGGFLASQFPVSVYKHYCHEHMMMPSIMTCRCHNNPGEQSIIIQTHNLEETVEQSCIAHFCIVILTIK